MASFNHEDLHLVIQRDGEMREVYLGAHERKLFMPALKALAGERQLVTGHPLPLEVGGPSTELEKKHIDGSIDVLKPLQQKSTSGLLQPYSVRIRQKYDDGSVVTETMQVLARPEDEEHIKDQSWKEFDDNYCLHHAAGKDVTPTNAHFFAEEIGGNHTIEYTT